jgi:hypothetical protein
MGPSDAARSPERTEQAKKAFLAEAVRMKTAVSKISDSRLNRHATYGKERIVMWKIAGSLLLTLGMLSGGWITVAAGAQEAMPEDALYPVKTWSEGFRLWAAGDGLPALDLALQFADRRAEELVNEAEAGLPLQESVLLRLMDQDRLALSLAAEAGGAEAPAALEKVRARLETHERVLEYLQTGSAPGADALLLQSRQTVRQRLELLSGDLSDPKLPARIMDQLQTRTNQPETAPADPSDGHDGEGAGRGAGGGPGAQGAGPMAEETTAPGAGNGIGNGTGPVDECLCRTTCGGQGTAGGGNPGGNSDCDCPTPACTPQKSMTGRNGNR